MAVIDIKDADFEEKVLTNKSPVLVDFWAPWCGPCRLAEPVLEALSQDFKDKIVIMKLNVDENPKTAERYQIFSIPTTVLFKNGQEIAREIGFSGREVYENLIKRAFQED